MQKIKIHKLGPISDCEVSIKGFMVLTGPQASGKSTLANGKVPKDKLSQIVNEYQWILYSDFMAHFLSRGKVERSKDYCIKGRKGKKRASCHKHTWKI